MNFGPHIRIFPILIMVALLAFSVRLVDFAAGVSSLSGAAHAAKGAQPEEAPPEAQPPDQGALAETAKPELPEKPMEKAVTKESEETKSEDKTAASEKDKPDANGKKEKGKAETSATKWRDAGDEDVSTEKDKMGVLDDLSARRQELDKRENEIKTREALLKVTEQEIGRKYQELSQLRTEIENLLDKQTEEEKARIVSLVKIYEGMKPKEAARIFDTLDVDVLMSVMSKMSERKLSPILAAMNPERAKTMTIMLAQEKKLPELPESN